MRATDTDPLHHVRKMSERLEHAAEHLRADVPKVDDPLFRAMFGSAAQVIDRLVQAFRTYERNRLQEDAS